jgi:hypothetical protein
MIGKSQQPYIFFTRKLKAEPKFFGMNFARVSCLQLGVLDMKEIPTQGDFIGPIKPQMNMTYRDYLHMINTGLGLPRYPSSGVPVIKTEDDMICPPSNYKLN